MKTTRSISSKLPFLILVVSVLLVVPGCQNEDAELKEEVTEEIGGELDTSMTQIMDEPIEPEVQAGHSAAVVIDETTIGIEEIMEPGPTVLTIRNSGLVPHSLAVTGTDGAWQIESPLEPGATANLEVVLQEGTYRVYDPLDETISTEITVRTGLNE